MGRGVEMDGQQVDDEARYGGLSCTLRSDGEGSSDRGRRQEREDGGGRILGEGYGYYCRFRTPTQTAAC